MKNTNTNTAAAEFIRKNENRINEIVANVINKASKYESTGLFTAVYMNGNDLVAHVDMQPDEFIPDGIYCVAKLQQDDPFDPDEDDPGKTDIDPDGSLHDYYVEQIENGIEIAFIKMEED